MKKIFITSLLFVFILSISPAYAAGNVLKDLNEVGRLALALGISTDDVNAEVENGKTLKEIAVEHGMPISVFVTRVENGNFNLTTTKTKTTNTKKITVKKKTSKVSKTSKKTVKKITKTTKTKKKLVAKK